MKKMILGVSCAALLFANGCDSKGLIEEGAVESKEAAAPSSMVPSAETVAPVGGVAGEAQKAGVGVGIRGDSLRNEEGVGKIIAGPAVALFNTREKVVFDIQIPHALNLFKALEGRVPKTHEEFMAKIIQSNGIQLPELKPGMKYRYRPDQGDLGELWVEPVE